MAQGELFAYAMPVEGTDLALGAQERSAIERLAPGTDLHATVLQKLRERVRESADKMSTFHNRWQAAEMRYQAYMNTKEYDDLRKAANKAGKAPEVTTVTVPYSYATVMTIVTYLVHTFCGRNPMFGVSSHRGDKISAARNMETLLQFNADHAKLIAKFYQFFNDGEMYGLQVLRTAWRVDRRRRTQMVPQSPGGFLMPGAPPILVPQQQEVVTFEGNEITNIDPFNFFPDPAVPMAEVSTKGEFVFWADTASKIQLKKAERAGLLRWVDAVPAKSVGAIRTENASRRAELSDGDSSAGSGLRIGSARMDRNLMEIMQGTVEIIPSEWGLGESDWPEKWIFTYANDAQIIQAEPLDADHDKHPVIVGEPYTTGYSFGNFAVTDMVAPMQDTLSWLINSHIYNVRAVLNNELIVNPLMVDVNDLKVRGPGRMIKMLPAAFGQNPNTAIAQLPVQDVTASHINDMAVIQRLADQVSAVNDNLRGVNQSGGRKTATEVRTSGESGASRLACHAMLISAQTITPLAEIMSINYQQYLSQEFAIQVLGPEGEVAPVRIGPNEIAGDFFFPIHDGTLPLDRVAMLDVWKEIFMAVAQDPQLRTQFNIVDIFTFIAKLGGAKNVEQFKVQMVPDQQLAAAAQAGNVVPMTRPA